MHIEHKPKYSVQVFQSLHDVTNHIANTPRRSWGTDSTGTWDSSWYGTNTFEEAIDLMSTGYDIDIQPTTIPSPTRTRQTQKPAPYGAYASVPRYLSNQPNSMIAFKQTQAKSKIITLYKDFTYSSTVSASDIIKYGKTAVAIVQALESQGVRVNLNVMFFSAADSETIGFTIPIKHAAERLSLKKMAFALAHPSMLRRIGFALIERFPSKVDFADYNYGRPASDQFIANLPKGSYHIPNKILDPQKFAADILKVK